MGFAKKICVVTGSRAEYGLLRCFIDEVSKDEGLELQLLVTGMHLSRKYGETWREIEQDGYKIDAKVDMLEDGNDSTAVALSTARGIAGCSAELESLRPDLLVVLGDRYEILSAVISAMFHKIPVAHFHGGETTEGAFDEAIRHSITKMSHVHFTASKNYRDRVIQLGESPERVFDVGAVAFDTINNTRLLNALDFQKETGVQLQSKNILVTFHPATLDETSPIEQFDELLCATEELPEYGLIFTLPNSDPGSEEISNRIRSFVGKNRHRAWFFTSMGYVKYLSALSIVDAVVGNSSSGIIEAPFFKIPTVNIGDRQKGRLMGNSVLNCLSKKKEIVNYIKYAVEGKTTCDFYSPYGVPGASKKATTIIRNLDLDGILKKKFNDVKSCN